MIKSLHGKGTQTPGGRAQDILWRPIARGMDEALQWETDPAWTKGLTAQERKAINRELAMLCNLITALLGVNPFGDAPDAAKKRKVKATKKTKAQSSSRRR